MVIKFFQSILLVVIVSSMIACKDDSPVVIPKVLKTTPGNLTSKIELGTTIKVEFDVDIELVNGYQITVNTIPCTCTVNGTILTVSAQLDYGTDYVVAVTDNSVRSLSGGYASAFSFSFTTVPSLSQQLSANLVVTNPSAQAVKVYNFLKENYGVKTVSSTIANVSWNINEALWVKQHTGKFPAMATFDYIHLQDAPANWIDYSQTQVVEDWWENNGLISACWHWNVPTAKDATTFTFENGKTTFSATNAVLEGTWENDIVKADLAELAGYIKLLRDKNIPVIWRPLHEAAGNTYEYNGGKAWFWWGGKGATAYKNLWIYMFNYFKEQGLNNLIWVWTTQTKDKDFYPGDAYVDIVGRDIYNKTTGSYFNDQFTTIHDTYPNKLVTLSEFGDVAALSAQWSGGARWSYFMPWYDYARTNDPAGTAFKSTEHVHANAAWWQAALSLDYVITRDEMPSLK